VVVVYVVSGTFVVVSGNVVVVVYVVVVVGALVVVVVVVVDSYPHLPQLTLHKSATVSLPIAWLHSPMAAIEAHDVLDPK